MCLLVFAAEAALVGKTIVIRASAFLLALTVGGAAHASCFLDENAATTATQVVTYLNACVDQPSLNDDAMLDVFFKLGATPDANGGQCRQAIILRGAVAGGKLRNSSPADKKSECDALKASPIVQAGLRRIGR